MEKMRDQDIRKGAVEQESPNEETNTSLSGQLPHRTDNPLVKANDTDFPEPGLNPEHSGQRTDREVNPEGATQNQDPGHRQKQNQNQRKDDPLAA